jgi:hypothetical protein
MRNAQFDRLKKESVNTVDAEGVLAELDRVFPGGLPSLEVCPEGFEAVPGLVLDDSRGEGALTPAGRMGVLTINEFTIMQRFAQ